MDFYLSKKKVFPYLGLSEGETKCTITLKFSLRGPDGYPGWVGFFLAENCPTTQAGMKSLYSYSSGNTYTLTNSNDIPIQISSTGIYAEVTSTAPFEYTLEVEYGKTYHFVLFNDWNVQKSTGGFSTMSVTIPKNPRIKGKVFDVGVIEWFQSNISVGQHTISMSRKEELPFNYVQLAYNYCTLSYTCALWTEDEWEVELNRLKEAGYTHVLVNAGLEEVWYEYLLAEGFSEDDILDFIPDTTHRAWWLMGNLEGERSRLSINQIRRQGDIGRFICNYCWNNGMVPVLNAFTGAVPTKWLTYFPNEKVIPAGANWCGYARMIQLDPTNEKYEAICSESFKNHAALYHEKLFSVLGITDDKQISFSGDPFHEGFNPVFPTGLTATPCATCMQEVQQLARPGVVWFLQHWQNNPSQALLNGVTPKYTIVEKLYKNQSSTSLNTAGYYCNGVNKGSIPWIWATLANFGDRPNLYGNFDVLKAAISVIENRTNGCIGWGILDEGIAYSIEYRALLDNILGKYPRIDPLGISWEYLLKSVFNVTRFQEGCCEGIMTAEPYFGINNNKTSAWGSSGYYYDKTILTTAAKFIKKDLNSNPEKLNDLEYKDYCINVLKNYLSDKFTSSDLNLDYIDQMDDLLSQSQRWTLWYYYQLCRKKATYEGVVNEEEALYFYRSWLCLITIWKSDDKTRSSQLLDYSCRHLSGLMKDFYKMRWQLYKEGKTQAEIRVAGWEYYQNAVAPTEPTVLSNSEFVSLVNAIVS